MLANQRQHARNRGDDDGAVLVTVVIVMFVGFIVATVVAASVLSTIGVNADNTGNTQAFVTAESGRAAPRPCSRARARRLREVTRTRSTNTRFIR